MFFMSSFTIYRPTDLLLHEIFLHKKNQTNSIKIRDKEQIFHRIIYNGI